MNKQSGLGRGLGALIPRDMQKSATSAQQAAGVNVRERIVTSGDVVQELDIAHIDPNPKQPREHFSEEGIAELAASIKIHGVMQPIIVAPSGDRYMLIAGERRLRASKLAGKFTIPAILRSATEQQKLELALVENLQRQDLSALEESKGMQRLMNEFNLTQQQVAERLGKSRSAVANMLRLLELPKQIRDGLESGNITVGHAKIIAGLPTEKEQITFYESLVAHKFSVREAEAMARSRTIGVHGSVHAQQLPEILAETRAIEQALGANVTISDHKGKGKIIIEYYSPEERREIISRMRGE